MKNFFKILTHLFPWNATPHKNFDLVCVAENFLNAFTSAERINDYVRNKKITSEIHFNI